MQKVFDYSSVHFPFTSRRGAPRLEVDGRISATWVALDGCRVLAVRNIGFRGFAIETDAPVELGLRRHFRFETFDGEPFEASAISVHCHRLHGSVNRWVSGWEFPGQAGLDNKIDQLMESAVGTLSID